VGIPEIMRRLLAAPLSPLLRQELVAVLDEVTAKVGHNE
jgi:hypothetical protein